MTEYARSHDYVRSIFRLLSQWSLTALPSGQHLKYRSPSHAGPEARFMKHYGLILRLNAFYEKKFTEVNFSKQLDKTKRSQNWNIRNSKIEETGLKNDNILFAKLSITKSSEKDKWKRKWDCKVIKEEMSSRNERFWQKTETKQVLEKNNVQKAFP